MNCPLCRFSDNPLFYKDGDKSYFRCNKCHLTFVDQHYWPTVAEERGEYDLHQNSSDDVGYRKFLSRLCDPMLLRLSQESQGLDFGCGNGPTLSVMFEEAGHEMVLYDKCYVDTPEALQNEYDFIVTSEVVEHLFSPGKELERLVNMLRPGGHLGIMTKLARDQKAFASWHYRNDITHVCFYSIETFEWIANHFSLDIEFIGDDVVILTK